MFVCMCVCVHVCVMCLQSSWHMLVVPWLPGRMRSGMDATMVTELCCWSGTTMGTSTWMCNTSNTCVTIVVIHAHCIQHDNVVNCYITARSGSMLVTQEFGKSRNVISNQEHLIHLTLRHCLSPCLGIMDGLVFYKIWAPSSIHGAAMVVAIHMLI